MAVMVVVARDMRIIVGPSIWKNGTIQRYVASTDEAPNKVVVLSNPGHVHFEVPVYALVVMSMMTRQLCE